MKIAIIIDDLRQCDNAMETFIREIREKSGCDYLMALMSGDFSADGPAKIDKKSRTEWALRHGIDLVIEKPVYTTLCDLDLYAFSAISLLTKFGIDCTLCIPCDADDPSILQRITMNLLVTDANFKKQIYRYLANGCSFWEARANVMETKIPGAKDVLSKSYNNYAVEYLKSMKYCYSPIVPLLIPDNRGSKMESSANHSFPSNYNSTETGNELSAAKQNYSKTAPCDDDFSEILLDYLLHSSHRPESIWGVTSTIAEKINANIGSFTTFSNFAQMLTSDRHPYEEIRQILYRMILRITRSKFTLFSLNDYALYVRILGCRRDAKPLLEHLQKHCQIPLLCHYPKDISKLTHSEQRLLDLDIQASHLCRKIMTTGQELPTSGKIEDSMLSI